MTHPFKPLVAVPRATPAPHDPWLRPVATRRGLGRPGGRWWTRAVTSTALVCTALLQFSPPAAADSGGVPIGIGSGSGVVGLPPGVVGTGAEMASSTYSLSMVDPVSQAMTAGVVGSPISPDYAITADLAEAGLSAIDTAEMARMARMAEEARRVALKNGQATSRLKAGAVPEQYEDLVTWAVATYCPQMSPGLLAAQLEAESNWNPNAQSPVGAKGIAQFMPATWKAYGMDGNGDKRKNILDPADAIPAAARYDCVLRDAVRKISGDPDALMLAAYNAGPGAVSSHGGIPPYEETQNYVAKILARAGELTDYEDGGAGAAGTADGCPTTSPAGTIRDSATRYTIGQICADSVAQARSPEAARAIKFALRNLGAPYSQPNRMGSFSFDCSSFVMRAYAAAGANVISGGWAPNTYAIEGVPWATHIKFADRRPGDLVYPFAGHISMSLAHGLKVHTNRPGDVSHVNDMYSSAYLTVSIDVNEV